MNKKRYRSGVSPDSFVGSGVWLGGGRFGGEMYVFLYAFAFLVFVFPRQNN